ncbi:hypothetical protein OAH81_01405 [Candidatus Pseudothioglobus singularis]|nr:hypothetical protein [Candidatus Pseudothioglobus singularis]MDB4821680.1 hypothetical protein [Candidatus Pseudothioglobus singularis]
MNQTNKTFNSRIPRKIFILISLISVQIAFADELNKMSTIDGESNKIVVESVDFQRLKSNDATYISIKSKTTTNVSCALYDKNGRPVTTVEGIITPPKTKLQAESKNVMVTSVKCIEQKNEETEQSTEDLDIYYKMPTFLLDD